VKTTKAVEPNEEDMDEPSGAQKGNHPCVLRNLREESDDR
jgi:hypothetical protein